MTAQVDRNFVNEFDEWIDVTGAVEPDTGWHAELSSIVCDAQDEIDRLRDLLGYQTRETDRACQETRETIARETSGLRRAHAVIRTLTDALSGSNAQALMKGREIVDAYHSAREFLDQSYAVETEVGRNHDPSGADRSGLRPDLRAQDQQSSGKTP